MMRTPTGVPRCRTDRATSTFLMVCVLAAALGWGGGWGALEVAAQAVSPAPDERTSRLDRVFQGIRYRLLDDRTVAIVEQAVGTPAGQVVSPHHPAVRYRIGRTLERSSDAGASWAPLGLDLPSGDAARIRDQGGVAVPDVPDWLVAESPVEPGLLWVGGYSGQVFLTRDGGASWGEIKLPGQATGARVRGLEPSYLEGGTVYLVLDRLVDGDPYPLVFRTENYGDDWTPLIGQYSGIPDDHTVAIVRADPEKEGLLFAGTPRGVFLSFDDGGSWDLFQFGLPDAPVMDMFIVDRDLVVTTSGAGTWVMDDISPLRRVMAGLATGEPYLFEPSPTYLDPADAGEDATPSELRSEAIFDYLLPSNVRNVRLEVFDGAGALVTEFRAPPPGGASGGVPAGAAVQAVNPQIPGNRAGVHRIVWDLTAGERDAADPGPRVAAGTYRLRMIVDGFVRERDFEVVGGATGR